tara:strand:+ start:7176 stop:9230 length:2055 start_codon:yes stop_codon:yes gene_type:complete
MKRDVDAFLKLKKQIKKEVKKFNKETKFTIKSSMFGGSSKKYNFYQNVVPNYCQFGIEQQVHESKNSIFRTKDGKGIVNRSGPVDIGDDLDMFTKDYNPRKNLGYSIRFNNYLGKTNPLTLNYKSKSERDKVKDALNVVQRLCRDKKRRLRNLISAGVDPVEVGELGKLKKGEKSQGYNRNPYDLSKFSGKGFKNNPAMTIPTSSKFGPFPYRTSGQDLVTVGALGGERSFIRRIAISQQAKKSIDILNLQFMADEIGMVLGEILINKRKQGVNVRLYIDAFSVFVDGRDAIAQGNSYILYRNMMAHGIPVYGFQCDSKWRLLKQEWDNTKKIKGRSWMHRFHEKIWIADGEVAIVGGANITASYHMVYPNGRLRWRDMDVEMTGRKTIKDLTNRIDEKVKLYNRDFPDPTKMKCFNKYPVGTVKWKNFAKNESKKYIPFGSGKISKDQDFAMKYVKKLTKGDFNLEGKKWKLRKVRTKGSRVVFSRPKFGELYLEQVYIDLINKSKYEILLENSYFIPSQPLLDALIKASQRGVKIKILTNGPETNEPPMVMTPLARFYYKDLMDVNQGNKRHEAEIYEWNGRYKNGKDIHFGMVHSKFAVFDRQITLIGSYNFDNVSRDFNEELAILYDGTDLALFIAKRFYEYDLNYTERIKYKDALKYKKPRNFGQQMILKMLRKMESRI